MHATPEVLLSTPYISREYVYAQKRIQMRQVSLFYKADEEYGRRVAE
jgi:catalase